MEKIRNETLIDFRKARENSYPVHDFNIKIWALNAAKKLNYSEFKASESWVAKFKKQNRICSRKVTKVVTFAQHSDVDKIQQSAKLFVQNSNAFISNLNRDMIFNSDQSGINYEYYSTRTLSDKGEKITSVIVKSKRSTTHSFTIQPTISASGKLLPKLYVCLQEPRGKFGPNISKNMFGATNLIALTVRFQAK